MFDIPERLRTVRNLRSLRPQFPYGGRFFRLSRLLLRTGLGRKKPTGISDIEVIFSRFSARAYSHDFTAAILVFQNNETAAILVFQTNPVGAELFSFVKKSFCSHKFA